MLVLFGFCLLFYVFHLVIDLKDKRCSGLILSCSQNISNVGMCVVMTLLIGKNMHDEVNEYYK